MTYRYSIVIKALPSYSFVKSYSYNDLDDFKDDFLYRDLKQFNSDQFVIEIRPKVETPRVSEAF